MKLVVILLALLIVGLLLLQQTGNTPVQNTTDLPEMNQETTPVVPVNQQGLGDFESRMNKYINEEKENRDAVINDAVSR